jgi:BirA family transcriptional regulator, biotin operon repressor / biotin---[acetyl-CoA-carboxylase] ligase
VSGLRNEPLGRPRLHLRRTTSTNDRARALALAGAPHGTLVTAGEQTAGRGRQGRRWSAPPGSALLASLVLRSPPPLLPLIAAVAVCDVVAEAQEGAPRATGEAAQTVGEPQIKWPNDIVVAREGRLAKLAGILTEGRLQDGWAVVGIGLNVAVRLEDLPAELRATAATLGAEPREIEPLLARLLAALERRLSEPAPTTLDAWRARDALRGRAIAWGALGSEGRARHGRAEGIDDAGRLIVALPDGGLTTLDAGEVHLEDVA